MQQIKNGFDDKYYISEDDCTVYDSERKCNVKPDRHRVQLKTKDGKYRKISQKELYRMCFSKEFYIDNTESLPDESFKEIRNTDGLYFISNKGRVKSIQGYEAIILKPMMVNGYQRVDIIQNGVRKTKLVSRLVALEWLENPPDIEYQLHHRDKNRENNEASNLVWMDPKEHKDLHTKIRRLKDAKTT